jgi:hypothetical protein
LFSLHSQDSLPRTITGSLLLLFIPLLITTFFLILGNTVEDGTTNPLTMFLLTRRLYLITMCIIGVLSIAVWVLAVRRSYFYLLGIPFQVLSVLVAMVSWLVIGPKITIAAVVTHDEATFYLVIMSPNGNYELSLVECVNQQCTINRLIHTDSDPIIDATIQYGVACNNYFVAQAFTQYRVIEHDIDIKSTSQTCQDE